MRWNRNIFLKYLELPNCYRDGNDYDRDSRRVTIIFIFIYNENGFCVTLKLCFKFQKEESYSFFKFLNTAYLGFQSFFKLKQQICVANFDFDLKLPSCWSRIRWCTKKVFKCKIYIFFLHKPVDSVSEDRGNPKPIRIMIIAMKYKR